VGRRFDPDRAHFTLRAEKFDVVVSEVSMGIVTSFRFIIVCTFRLHGETYSLNQTQLQF
jgi:hypothetical protein